MYSNWSIFPVFYRSAPHQVRTCSVSKSLDLVRLWYGPDTELVCDRLFFLFFFFQDIPDFRQQDLFFAGYRRSRRRCRSFFFLLSRQPGQQFDEQENRKSDNKKVKRHLQEISIIQGYGGNLFTVHNFGRFHHPLQVRKVHTSHQ